ncbi:hypothetical protein MNBD_NITROSPINAE01-574 [hydrothermal vent metagenome]|uniref:Protein kinase domain-containing protein n=1 Tax=hydrothermal vent metagenome TaxID=652676 RepID=A0A3B1BTU7_9ZZZZ
MEPDKTAQLASTIDRTLEVDFIAGHSNYVEVPLGYTFQSRYVVEAKISEGGMGVVYAAFDTQLRRKIAIKLLKRNLIQDKQAVAKLIKEAQVSMMLTHPGIMRLINFEQHGPYAYLLMEFVEGRNLREIAGSAPERKLSCKYVAKVGYSLCEALSYAHKKNVIHRDIKPANIVVGDAEDSVKLMDFGIAKVLAPGAGERPPVAGTLSYIAPEIFKGAVPDPRADIYALGLTFYELLAGFNPCNGNSAQEVIDRHLNKKPPSLIGVDKALSSVIFRCVERMPNARFQTVGELHFALGRYLGVDEGVKIALMREKLDREKQAMDYKLHQFEREKKDLKREREKKQNHTGHDVSGNLKDEDGQTFAPLVLVALFSGVLAAFVRYLVIEGRLVEFETIATYNAVAGMLAVAIMVALPSYYLQKSHFLITVFAGLVLGDIGYLCQDFYMNYAFNHDIWGVDNFAMHVSISAPLALGAGAARFGELAPVRILRALFAGCVAGFVALAFSYVEFAETILGLDDAYVNYFYFPLMAVFIWSAVEAERLWFHND